MALHRAARSPEECKQRLLIRDGLLARAGIPSTERSVHRRPIRIPSVALSALLREPHRERATDNSLGLRPPEVYLNM